ncbi:hypothetical protein NQ317_006610 [Molorchus minor]|uniref:Protein sleepless n=1 Tax=Molorchus minor TaxID=1323400 RepID=A0ABQ9JZW8_9CUCU|nr:hypothetical protein NQ317_006610 [Molorchus minor]
MKGFKLVSLLVFLTTMCIDSGSATKCYACTSVTNQECEKMSNVSAITVLDCPDETPVCIKLVVAGTTTRLCENESTCATYDKASGTTCKSCTTDLCNAANSKFIPHYTVSIGILAALYASLKLLF